MRRYTLRIPPEVESFIRHLHPRIKTRIRAALEEIETDPKIGKPLKEPLQGLYSFRVSQYRIIYQIKAQEVLIEVIDIAERKIVYERVAALLGRTS